MNRPTLPAVVAMPEDVSTLLVPLMVMLPAAPMPPRMVAEEAVMLPVIDMLLCPFNCINWLAPLKALPCFVTEDESIWEFRTKPMVLRTATDDAETPKADPLAPVPTIEALTDSATPEVTELPGMLIDVLAQLLRVPELVTAHDMTALEVP